MKARTLCMTAVVAALVLIAGPAFANTVQHHPVTICHRTDAATNPYVKITVDDDAVDSIGPADHQHHTGPVPNPPTLAGFIALKANHVKWGDIIPPTDNDGDKAITPKNWNEQGMAVYDNGCKPVPVESPSPTVPPTSPPCEDCSPGPQSSSPPPPCATLPQGVCPTPPPPPPSGCGPQGITCSPTVSPSTTVSASSSTTPINATSGSTTPGNKVTPTAFTGFGGAKPLGAGLVLLGLGIGATVIGRKRVHE